MEAIRNAIAARPRVAHSMGRVLFAFGTFLIVIGLIASAGLTAINATRQFAKQPPIGLAEAYPNYSIWWIPEGPMGYVLAGVAASVGIYLALRAKKFLKVRPNRGRGRGRGR